MVTCGDDDDCVRSACEVLYRLEPDPMLCPDAHDVRVQRWRPGLCGCVSDDERPGGPLLIYISTESVFYRRAQIGDLLGLVMLLHHEQFHIVHGRAEGPAYAASLALLDRIGAGELRPELVQEVECARDTAVRDDCDVVRSLQGGPEFATQPMA